jgi:hypothetical protein
MATKKSKPKSESTVPASSSATPSDPEQTQQHTPGPYVILYGGLPGDDHAVIGSKMTDPPTVICEIEPRNYNPANVALLMSAPDMLQALQSIMEWTDTPAEITPIERRELMIRNAARAAIVKATRKLDQEAGSQTVIANSAKKTSPIELYHDLKAKHPGVLILFRVGDFYELFFDDAHTVARVLGLTFTSRFKASTNPVPMAGFPYHQLDNYLRRLIQAGLRCAVCEG